MAFRSLRELDILTDVQVPIDLRGWEVRTSVDAKSVGKVHDVLVDESGAARYLDLDLGALRRHVLLPVGQARTDEHTDVLWVQGVDSEGLKRIPEYGHDPDSLNAEAERRLADEYDGVTRHRYHRAEYGGLGAATGVSGSPDPTVLGTEEVRLRRLGELSEYEVADHDPDPRGWSVVGAAGEKLGEVDDLVVDPQALKARYLEVELDRDVVSDRHTDRRALIPVGYARVEEDGHRVRVDALGRSDADTLPRFGERFDDEYEERIDRHFAARFHGEARYGHPRYQAERLYGARAAGTGSITRDPATGRICDVRLRTESRSNREAR